MKLFFALLLIHRFAGAFQSAITPRAASRRLPSTLFDSQPPPREFLERELEETKVTLGHIDVLEASVEKDDANLDNLSDDIERLEQEIGRLAPVLPAGLSLQEYETSVRAFSTLPLSLKLGMYMALEMNTDEAPYPTLAQYPEIVSRLYEDRLKLTAQKLEDGVKEAQDKLKNRRSVPSLAQDENKKMETEDILKELMDGQSVDDLQSDNVVKQQLGRVTRKEGKAATAGDLETLMGVLEGNFVVRGAAEQIPGGYVVRGSNRKQTPKELIAALDTKLPSDWNAQVSYLPDITNNGLEDSEADPVLVLLNKDFSADSSWILPLSAGAGALTTFLFGISAYATNQNMATEFADRNALGDFSGLDWFNGHLVEILLPLFIIQVMHELGHFLVAQQNKVSECVQYVSDN